jgi:hypothetical protein
VECLIELQLVVGYAGRILLLESLHLCKSAIHAGLVLALRSGADDDYAVCYLMGRLRETSDFALAEGFDSKHIAFATRSACYTQLLCIHGRCDYNAVCLPESK